MPSRQLSRHPRVGFEMCVGKGFLVTAASLDLGVSQLWLPPALFHPAQNQDPCPGTYLSSPAWQGGYLCWCLFHGEHGREGQRQTLHRCQRPCLRPLPRSQALRPAACVPSKRQPGLVLVSEVTCEVVAAWCPTLFSGASQGEASVAGGGSGLGPQDTVLCSGSMALCGCQKDPSDTDSTAFETLKQTA